MGVDANGKRCKVLHVKKGLQLVLDSHRMIMRGTFARLLFFNQRRQCMRMPTSNGFVKVFFIANADHGEDKQCVHKIKDSIKMIPKYILQTSSKGPQVDLLVANTSLSASIGIQKVEDLGSVKVPLWLSQAIEEDTLPVLIHTQELWGLSGDSALEFLFKHRVNPN